MNLLFLVSFQGPHWKSSVSVRLKSTTADPTLGWHLQPKLDMLFSETTGCGYVIANVCGLNKKKGGMQGSYVKCLSWVVKKKKGLKQNQYLLKGINVGKEIMIVQRFLKY